MRHRWFARLGILCVCALWSLPTVGLLVCSFRPREEVLSTGWWTIVTGPAEVTLEDYQTVLTAGMGTALVNSVLVTIPATLIPIAIAAHAAYAFARMRFRGREVLFLLLSRCS